MPEFIITKGSIKQDNVFKKPGERITLSKEEAAAMDPEGICLKSRDQYDKEARDLAAKSRAAEEASRKLGHSSKGNEKPEEGK